MIRVEDIRWLAAQRHDEGVVSVHLSVRPRLVNESASPLAAFKGAAKRYLAREASERWKAAFERERPRIRRWLEGRRTEGRGIVAFACKPNGLWLVRVVPFPLPSLVVVDEAPYTALLTQALDEGEALAVAHVQKDRARIWVAEQGDADDGVSLASDVHRRHSRGGWSQARFQRHVDVEAAEHRSRVVEELLRLNAERPFRRLALGGAEPTVSDFRRNLPEPLASRVIGTFPVDAKHDTDAQILERVIGVFEETERASERAMVQEVLDAAAAGGPGVVGLDGTLAAVVEGRVRTLLVASGAHRAGSVCPNCEYLSAKGFRRCPVCGSEADATQDVVGVAMERALLSGAHVESLLGEARDELLSRGHPVGAILRY